VESVEGIYPLNRIDAIAPANGNPKKCKGQIVLTMQSALCFACTSQKICAEKFLD
jgi:hypothetical protein